MTFTPIDYNPYDFANRRHIGPSPDEMAEMLQAVGVPTLDALIDETVPASIRQAAPLTWAPLSEQDLLARMRDVAGRNRVMTSLIGQGYYGTVTPPAIQRNILENPAWYTAYTPYQPEIAQGRLEALLNYQTMVADLTGLPVANASLLDEATAAAEAMTMAERCARSKARAFFVDEGCHPQTVAVIQTRALPLGIEVIVGPVADMDPAAVFGAIFQYPGTHGEVRDFTAEIAALHAVKAVAIVATDLLALCLLKEPGAMGADIAVGSSQRFGVPMGYGGPHAAFFSCKDEYKRQMPGRIVGVSIDARGNMAYRLSLQTREQHIRREKATSNVCTAQALLAVMASMYGVFHGPKGLRAIAERVHFSANRLSRALRAAGAVVQPRAFFDTITVEVGVGQAGILAAARAEGLNFRKIGHDRVGISVDETTDDRVLVRVLRAFGIEGVPPHRAELSFPEAMLRTTDYMTHPVFHMNRAESEMMRYMRRLSDRDLALDRAMIPLGSCTMKLNAAAEMMPITWPEFSSLHPFCPPDQAVGYHEAIDDLQDKLCEITGYDAFSMQPNSGAQGEYAGLLTIQAYHRARGDGHRKVCLIPVSAHGTNPASAQMAGMQVVVVGGDAQRRCGYRRFPRQGSRGGRQSGGLHDHLSVHPRRVRRDGARDLPDHPPLWRAGLSGRGQHERHGRAGETRRDWQRCQPPEPAQDLCHPAWWRGAGDGADWRQGASGTVSAGASHDRGGREPWRAKRKSTGAGFSGAVWVGLDLADQLGLLPDDGRRGADAGDAGGHSERQLYRGAVEGGLSGAVHGQQGPGGA